MNDTQVMKNKRKYPFFVFVILAPISWSVAIVKILAVMPFLLIAFADMVKENMNDSM